MSNLMRVFWLVALIGILMAGPLGHGQATPQDKDKKPRPLVISAIPDQDHDTLKRLYDQVAVYLTRQLGVPVQYQAVPDYPDAVRGFKAGDLDLVWFGGLTGVQAKMQVSDAHYIAQRDIDDNFRSVFIANQKSDIRSLDDLKGKTFTFGNEWSTSGRLMPQHFLKEKGIKPEDFKGKPGYSSNHDKTIYLVAEGTYAAGVVNEQVWKRYQGGSKDGAKRVRVIITTPPYHDYHWLLHPEAARRFGGADFVKKLQHAFLVNLIPSTHAEILDQFGAKKFIPTRAENYKDIERAARAVGLNLP
jgi:phosphonate transport system substrate-binding protein